MNCTVENCTRQARSENKGLCQAHDAQLNRYGYDKPRALYGEPGDKLCEAEWCERLVHTARLCIPCNKRRNRYKLTYEEYLALKQECAVCGTEGKLHVDHDHTTGKVRGLLCHGCNLALGLVKDSPERLRKLADYIGNSNTTIPLGLEEGSGKYEGSSERS